ncbi:MAG: hypothetical protein ACOC4M_16650 [Promethearchaeia archaeon]
MDKKELEKIQKEIEKEFPHDHALQQIHIARKILAKEAESKGMSYLEYIKSVSKDVESTQQK